MRDIYESLTSKIIDQLEQGVVPWVSIGLLIQIPFPAMRRQGGTIGGSIT